MANAKKRATNSKVVSKTKLKKRLPFKPGNKTVALMSPSSIPWHSVKPARPYEHAFIELHAIAREIEDRWADDDTTLRQTNALREVAATIHLCANCLNRVFKE